VRMSYEVIKQMDLDKTTIKSLVDLLDALLDVNENDPANAENEYTISDNNGGTIELSVEQAGNKKVAILRRSGLKLTIEKTND
jgi:hypothetical protein